MTTVEYKYQEDGSFYTCIVTYKGLQYQVMHKEGNSAVAEMQRADMLVRGLIAVNK